jgi:putative ABC transport system permease protein
MFKLNLKIALRNLFKNKSYTLINILGLSIGMASCILIFIFIKYQLSFDRFNRHEDRIVRFVTDWKYNSYTDYSSGAPMPFGAAARTELSGIDKIASIGKNGGVIIVKDPKGNITYKDSKTVYFAEPGIFDILTFDWIGSKPGKEFAAPNKVVLSEKTAKLFFGSAKQAMGKNFTFWNSINLKVIGVFKDLPSETSLPLNIVLSFVSTPYSKNQDWQSVSSYNQCYALLKKGVTPDDVQRSLHLFNYRHYTSKNLAGNQISVLQSLRDIHFSERYGSFADTSITKKEIYALAVIGLFLILTACINFINLATAQSVNRSKEVGVRKVMGSGRKQLVFQFLTETFAITIISLILACILSELAIPTMENLFKGNVVFSLFKDPVIFAFMIVLILLVSFLAGFYPAMVMSGFSPALAIKNKVKVDSGSLSIRKVLVVVQFSITIILIISTLVIMKQMKYVREKPLGFNTEAIAMINIPGDSVLRTRMHSFKEQVAKISGVQKVSYCMRPPLSESVSSTNFRLNGQENKDFEVRLTPTDEDYFSVFGLEVIAGHIFKASDTTNGYVANETFVRKVKLPNAQAAIGTMMEQNGYKARIVAVVKDFNDQSLREKISPMVFYQYKKQYYSMAVKFDKSQMISAMKKIEALWASTFTNEVYGSVFLDDDINNYYENERNTGFLFRVFAAVIIFISFIGLFGLISFVATQRTKEVAIRKVLGASTIELIKMLNGSFILMVFIANLVAWPLAYIFVSKWLSGFAYRMNLSVWPFVAAMIISMMITLITVSIRSYKAATENTIDALKYE